MRDVDIMVVGGGAAGMLASATAARLGAKVRLLERNDKLGKKLAITGKGRCNLTNDCPVSLFLENVLNGKQFLQSAINSFTPRDTMDFFETIGVRLKTERGARVFPVSDDANEVAAALREHALQSGVKVIHCRALGLEAADGRITGLATAAGGMKCGAVILATGGVTYPATGSDGDGHKMAMELGHTITPLRGSLVPLAAQPEICGRMQGLALKNVRLSVYNENKAKIFEGFGELLFTHFGLSGPLTLSASSHMRENNAGKYTASIDLKPALDEQKLGSRILRDFGKNSNRAFENSLGDLVHKSMVPVIVEKSGIPPGTKVHSVSRDQRLGLVRLLKAFTINIDGRRPIEEAVVTSGGVELKEIDPKTMESKLVKGLFFAGEIIDADAYTGGYNLQIAWSTAYAAGKAAANKYVNP